MAAVDRDLIMKEPERYSEYLGYAVIETRKQTILTRHRSKTIEGSSVTYGAIVYICDSIDA